MKFLPSSISIVSCLVLCVSSGNAEPMYTSSGSNPECVDVTGSVEDWVNLPDINWDSQDPIYIYLEDDFGSELKDCLDNDDSGDNDSQIKSLSSSAADEALINVVLSAMEVWNLQSRGPVFKFAGTLNQESAESNCSAFTDSPAIFIRLVKGCNPSGAGCSSSGTNGDIKHAASCTSDPVAEITMWADVSSPEGVGCDDCDSMGASSFPCRDLNSDGDITIFEEDGMNEWSIDGEARNHDIKGLIVHELGHALGLRHPYNRTPNPLPGANASNRTDLSIMDISSNEGVDARFLFPWERDCVDDGDNFRGERQVRYRWQTFDEDGNTVGSIKTPSTNAVKGFLSGGGVLYGLGLNYFRYHDDKVYASSVNTGGVLSFSASSTTFGDNKLENLQYPPVFMKAWEHSGSTHNHRINFLEQSVFSATTGLTEAQYRTEYDPPYMMYRRSSNRFDDHVSSTYEVCGTSCVDRKSHIPLVSAWNDARDTTVFASVNTSRSSDQGRVEIHPGFDGSSVYQIESGDILNQEFTTSQRPSFTPSDFGYTLETDVAPGIACSDVLEPFNVHDYNCMIFWVDRGTPDSRILYAYFEVDGSGNLDWRHSFSTHIYTALGTGAVSVTHLSAAYFAEKFWIAWKDSKNNSIKYAHRRTDLGGQSAGWSSTTTISRTRPIVDPPTWQYLPHYDLEASLMWTEDP
jgi:hypothetical protein